MIGATLFRRNGPAWRFEWDSTAKLLMHHSGRGNVYAIHGIHECKPIWIGRLIISQSAWITNEARIGAEYIQFDNGDEYWFGGKPT